MHWCIQSKNCGFEQDKPESNGGCFAFYSEREMNKPKPYTKTYYDFMQCRNYITTMNKLKNRGVEEREFWHYLCNTHEVRNGSEIYLSREGYDELIADHQDPNYPVKKPSSSVTEFYNMLLDEFADEDGELVMWVEW